MQDQPSSSTTPANSAPQTTKLIIPTRKEGVAALTIGIIHIIIFPLATATILILAGVSELSPLTALLINMLQMLSVTVALTIFLGGFFKRSWVAFRASPKDKLIQLILLSGVAIYISIVFINLVIMPALGLRNCVKIMCN